MRLRAGNHGASAAAKSFTVAVMAAAMAAQLLSISHEMTVRHFRCAEHGELTHVAVSGGADTHRAGCAHLAVNRGDAGTPAGHEHCDFTFIVQGSAQTPAVHTTVRILPPSVLATRPALVLPAPGRAFLLASAPKTSPPVA